MTDFEIQVCGRLTALEFVLEVLLANELAFQPEDASEAFKNDLISRPAHIKKGPVDVDVLQAIQRQAKDGLENFVRKVSEREAELRTRLGLNQL